MIKIDKKKVEEALGKRLQMKVFAWGLDCASRTGWASCTADKDYLYIDCGFIDVDSKDIYFKYNQILKSLTSLFSGLNTDLAYKLIIEDTFFGRNINALKMLSRIGMIAYITGKQAGIQDISFIFPTSSRKAIGIKGTLKKPEVHKELTKILGINLQDVDICDAVVLALTGLVKTETIV